MTNRRYGIRLHVAALTLIPLLVMAASLGSFFLHDRFAEMDRDLLARGQLIVRQLAVSSEYGVFSNNRSFLTSVAKSALLESDVKAVMLLNAAGEVMEASGETKLEEYNSLRVVSQASRILDNGSALLLYQPILSTQIALEDADVGHAARQIGAVIIAMSWHRTNHMKSRLLWLTVMATAALLLITLYLTFLASRRIIEPIRELSGTVDAIGAGNLNARAMASNHVSEIHTLANGINHMAMELQHERDILQQRIDEATEQLHTLAFYDTLTLLPNRRLLQDRLAQTMSVSKRSGCYGALMFLDLDNFQPLNDMHGHEVGDLLLVEAARRLKSCVREMDTVARFGGDEFVVMLSDLSTGKAESISQAGLVAQKILGTLSEPYLLAIRHQGQADVTIEHHCTASIGVVLFIDHESSQDDILKWADTAMYHAKKAGRNSIRFHDAQA